MDWTETSEETFLARLKLSFTIRWYCQKRNSGKKSTWIQTYIECCEISVVKEMKMEGGVLSVTSNNNRFRSHLKNAASALCAGTLPKQRRGEPAAVSSARHHTYPRATPPKRAAIACRMEPLPLACTPTLHPKAFEPPQQIKHDVIEDQATNRSNTIIKWKGTVAR